MLSSFLLLSNKNPLTIAPKFRKATLHIGQHHSPAIRLFKLVMNYVRNIPWRIMEVSNPWLPLKSSIFTWIFNEIIMYTLSIGDFFHGYGKSHESHGAILASPTGALPYEVLHGWHRIRLRWIGKVDPLAEPSPYEVLEDAAGNHG